MVDEENKLLPNQHEALFDGEIFHKRLQRFLQRIEIALNDAQKFLPSHNIEQIIVDLHVDANLNIGLAGFGGIGASRGKSISFVLKPKT